MKTAVIYDKWLAGLGGGEVVACTMAKILKDVGYEVLLLSKELVSIQKIKNNLNIDLNGVIVTTIQDEVELKKNTIGKDLFINTSFMDYSYGRAKRNVYYVHFPTVAKKGILHPILNLFGISTGLFNFVLLFFQKTKLHKILPQSIQEKISDRLRAGIYFDLTKRLESYDVFITHSEYVAKWIKKEWNIEATVLYPPVTSFAERVDKKKHCICSVGRFFVLGHGKKQEVMIDAFKTLSDQLKTNSKSIFDWQLHLVGGVGNEPSSIRFVEELKRQAEGYPIFFHINENRKEVERILSESTIYWHATGFGESKTKDPIKFEHFGIAPVEAIFAGCFPILFDGGGLPEIIRALALKKENHIFIDKQDLIEKTIKTINNGACLNDQIRTRAGKIFSEGVFKDKFLKIIQTL